MRQLLTVCDMGMIEASDQSRDALDVLNQVTGRLTEISEHAVTAGLLRYRCDREGLVWFDRCAV